MEECRADMVGLFFGFNKDVQKIFEIKEEDYANIIYAMWLTHFRKGTLGLHLFNKDNKKWGQAHTQGAWVFTHFILENQPQGEEIIKIVLDEENKTFTINVNKHNIIKHGKALVEKILTHLHIYEATGDFENGQTEFKKGQTCVICRENVLGTSDRFTITYKDLYKDVKPGGFILVNDGQVELLVDH